MIRMLNQKETIKKVHGPTTTLAGIARRGVFVRPGRCSCLQVTTKKTKTKTGTTFLSACCFYHLHIIALVTSHSVFRSPYNTVEGNSKEDKPQVYLSWNCSRTTQDWRGFPLWLGNLIWGSLQFPETYVLPKNPDNSICYQTVIDFNSRDIIARKFQEQRNQYKEHWW